MNLPRTTRQVAGDGHVQATTPALDTPTTAAAFGRPRDPANDTAILEAARELFQEKGYGAISMDDVARAAGVGKQTIYRRWPSKAELAFDAFSKFVTQEATADLGLERYMHDMARVFRAIGPSLRMLMAEAQHNQEMRERFKARLIEQRRTTLDRILNHEQPRMSAHSRAITVTMISGAFWVKLLLDEPINSDFVNALAQQVKVLLS